MRTLTVAVSGYYGFGNVGDEAILAAIKEGLEAAIPGVDLVVFSGDPAHTRRVHGVRAVHRADLSGLIKEIRGCDLLLSGGGSLIQDVTSARNIPYYLGVISIAQAFRKKVMVYAQGIGPVEGRLGRLLVPKVLDRVALITVRDEVSASLLRSLGVTKPRLEVTADASLSLEPPQGFDAHAALSAEGLDPQRHPIIGLALRSWHEGVDVDELARLADSLIRDLKAQLIFLPMHMPGDREVSLAVMSRMEEGAAMLSDSYHPREVMGIIGALDLVIGIRLHALIFAASQGVPMIGLSYDPKIDSFLRSIEWGAFWSLADVTVGRVVDQAKQALARRAELVALLKSRISCLRQRAMMNNELLANLLLTCPASR